MRLHIIEGEAGCHFAAERQTAAIIVDALRASATAAALLAHGALELLVTSTVADAFALKQAFPDAMLFGERGGLPPEGFDYGNSPLEAVHGKGRRIIFTTTTGAGRLIEAWGASTLLMGTTVNAAAVVQYLLMQRCKEVTLVPAGLMSDPNFNAQEDWTAAAHIADNLCRAAAVASPVEWGSGYERYLEYRERMAAEGMTSLFQSAPHADKLRAVGKEEDIGYCARTNLFAIVPVAVERLPQCVIVRNAAEQQEQ